MTVLPETTLRGWGTLRPACGERPLGSTTVMCAAMILPPLTMDLGLLLISVGVVNLWRARENAG